MTFSHEDLVNDFVLRFINRTLPKPEWTHQAHLAVGLWHVLHHGDDALALLRERITTYNEATGTPNSDTEGYHETLTGFFVEALKAYAHSRQGLERLDLFNGIRDSYLADRSLGLGFYSRSLIDCVEARRHFMAPDLRPLSSLSTLFPESHPQAAPFLIRPAGRHDAEALIKLVLGLAEFEKLEPPDEAAQARLVEDAFGAAPRIEVWLGITEGRRDAVAYAIFLETYSSFLALPSLYIEDIFVDPTHRGKGLGGALLNKAVELAYARGCGRVEWTALDWNVNAQQVYEQRLGAKRMSEWLLYRMTREDMEIQLRRSGKARSSQTVDSPAPPMQSNLPEEPATVSANS